MERTLAMRCDEIRPRLEAYVDAELTEAERGQLRDHLADCPECGPEAVALERLHDGIRRSRLRRDLADQWTAAGERRCQRADRQSSALLAR